MEKENGNCYSILGLSIWSNHDQASASESASAQATLARACDRGFRVQGLGFKVEGSGFRV